MEQRVAIVTGGLRGLGRAMAFGLAREGHSVLAVGHIDADVAEIKATTAGTNFAGKILPLSPICAGRPIATASSRWRRSALATRRFSLTTPG